MPASKVLERIAVLEEQIARLQTSITQQPGGDARTELEETLVVLCQIHRVYAMRIVQIERQDAVRDADRLLTATSVGGWAGCTEAMVPLLGQGPMAPEADRTMMELDSLRGPSRTLRLRIAGRNVGG